MARPRLAWWGWGLAALGYFAAASLATWPVVARFGTEIPGELTDPLEHLWIMRWLRSCLIEGRNPLFCPSIQAPVGVPLGAFPTLHLQTILYILLRLATANDAAIFTTIWFAGFVATGVGSIALARWAIPGLGAGVAWVAGLGVMLCGPMLMHAHGHLETMQLGVVPPFLIGWLRFVDSPSRRRLAVAAALYLLVTAAAPYFAVLAIFPAAWYAGWAVASSPEKWATTRRLAPWLAGFGVVVLPGVALLFGAQIRAALAGFPMTRSKRLFDHFGAPPWSSLVPTSRHALGRLGGLNLFELNGYRERMTECASYLGVVALGLLAWAALRRVAFPRRGYWWSVLALLVVLSWGSRQDLFGASVRLPAGWIYDVFPPFHLIRVPARFNLFAAAVAVVPAAAGLRAVVEGRRRFVRVGLLVTLAALMVADLAMVPFRTAAIPDPPALYAAIRRTTPTATVLDAPLFDSTKGQTYSSLWGYWQQRTGLATSGGYPGLTNARFDAEVARPSVFSADRMHHDSAQDQFGRDGPLDVRDRAWLEMTAHGFSHAVLHLDAARFPEAWAMLAGTLLREDQGVGRRDRPALIVSRDRIAPPRGLTWMTDQGWRTMPVPRGSDEIRSVALREARIVVYQPGPGGPVVLSLIAVEAFAAPRVIRVVEDDNELASTTLRLDAPQTVSLPPIALTPGLHTWTLRSDGDSRPARSADRVDDAGTPYSFRLTGVRLRPATPR